MVVVIIGTVAAIAVPRFMNASQRSADAAKAADAAVLQRAIDLYTAEHFENCPAIGPSGLSTDAAEFILRLTGKTLRNGKPDATGLYGPYLREFPANPANGKATLRINGPAAGKNSHGWRYDTAKRLIEPDDQAGDAVHIDVVDGGSKGVIVGGIDGAED
ncbi:MAG: hypothetical protein AMXMBFR58_13570 [Phycisphaerae bacterium]|nr:hypothetical protein [Phycisphaerales bacterium]MCK6477263.1 hypothetical protein [Phycisphaerales bacterium]